MHLEEIKKVYSLNKGVIVNRLEQFKEIWVRQDDREIFTELSFCLLTPQSKAKTCWEAVCGLVNKDILWEGEPHHILPEVCKVRFKNKKSLYIYNARSLFSEDKGIKIFARLKQFSDIIELREWLVKNVKGLGYKEASHFLRNIGLGENLAILDRHILKNLRILGVIREIPKSLTKKKYLEIERKMIEFSRKIKIPAAHLDLALWCKEAGEVFK